MVNQYYFYAVDEDFGPFFLKYSSYFPYGAKLCFNGHEYLKRQLTKEGVGVAVHRCSSSCFAEAFAREYGHQWTTIGVSGYGSWLVSTSRSLIRCSRRGCRRHRRTHFRTSRSLQTLHPSTPPALRSLRLPATVMAARCQRTTPQLPPPSTQTPIALAVCKSRSLSRSVRTSGFPFHSLYPA